MPGDAGIRSLFERFPRETGGRKNLIIYMEDGFSRGLRENLDGRMSIRRIFIRRIFIRRMSIRRMSIRRIFIRRMLIRRIFIRGKTVLTYDV